MSCVSGRPAGIPGNARERDAHLRGQIRHPVSMRRRCPSDCCDACASVRLQRLRLACRSGARGDTYLCDASWQCMSLDRYTQSTLNVARHAKKSEVEGKIETQIEYQEEE